MTVKLGTIVRRCLLGESEVERLGSGEFAEVKSALDEPSFGLVDIDGHEYTSAQSLTRLATVGEELAYWRERAKAAERRSEEARHADATDGQR
jgi:hypothetical protein